MNKYLKYIEMKVISMIILALLCLVTDGNAQWKRVMTIPAPYENAYYLDVYFLESNPRYGWACGRNGVVIRTTNGGDTWDVTTITGAYQLESIHFVNEKVGYTSGLVSNAQGSGVFKSLDGGKTWYNVSPKGTIDVWGTFFLDENTGLSIGGGCGGNQQQFYRTTNGGKDWIGFYQNAWDSGLSDLIIDKKTGVGFATSSGIIWYTNNFGITWSIFAKSGNNDWQEEITLVGRTFLVPYSLDCTGGGGSGGARISTDFGVSWRQKSFGTSMFGSFLLDENRGWVVGWNRSAYYTSDAGINWENRNCGITPGADLDDIWFINDTLGFVVGLGVYKYIGYNTQKPEIAATASFPTCEGDTVVLWAKAKYDYYKWSTGETTPSIKVTKSGKYSLWAAHNECDSATSLPIDVSFLPKPTLTLKVDGKPMPCEGDTVTISLLENYPTILWSTGESENQILVTKSGKYSVSVIDGNGCKNSDSLEITFAALPESIIDIIGKTDFCVGDSVWLQSRLEFPKYEWFKDSQLIPNSNHRTILVKESGSYSLQTWNENGCTSFSKTVNVNVRLDTNLFDFTISTIQEFSLDSAKFPAIVCKKLKLRSKSWQTQTIENLYLYKNLSFSVPQSQLPIILKPFEEVEIEICYSPKEMDFEKDTLYINDRCAPHILPLIAKGIPNNYNAGSKCDIPIEFETIEISDYGEVISGPPYPNPAGGIIQIPIKILYYDKSPNFNLYLTDIYGKIVQSPKIEEISNSEVNLKNDNESSIKYKVEIESKNAYFDTSMLPNGIYFVILQTNETKIYKVVINK